jgi:hypothetical protein
MPWIDLQVLRPRRQTPAHRGWNDGSVPPDVAVNYYKDVVAKTGAKATRESMRFLWSWHESRVGTNAENFNADTLGLIEQWKRPARRLISS